jgi:hypothetical protein
MAGFYSTVIDPYRFYLKENYPLEDASDLTNNNGVTFIAGGKYNNCANFVATSSQYLSKLSATNFDPVNNTLISFWFKIDSAITGTLLSWGEDFNTSQYSYGVTIDASSKLCLKLYLGDSIDTWHLVGTTTVTTDVLHHVSVSFVNGFASLYMDTILEATNDTIKSGAISRLLLTSNLTDIWGTLPLVNTNITYATDATFPRGSRSVAIFDGSAKGYVFSISSYGIPTGNSARTLCSWIKVTTPITGLKTIVGYGDTSGNSMFQWGVNEDGKLDVEDWGDSCIGSTVLSADTWYFAAVTFDGTTMKLYLDGVLDGSLAMTTGTGASYFFIGNWHQSWGDYYFTGSISDLKIYNRALSASELLSIYAEAPPLAIPTPTTKTLHIGAHTDSGIAGLYTGVVDELYCWQSFPNNSSISALDTALYTHFYHVQPSTMNFFDYAIDTYIDNFISAFKFDGNYNDSINNVTGTVILGSTFTTGIFDRALYCYLQQGMSVPVTSGLNLPELISGKIFTINFWMKYSTSPTGGHYIMGAIDEASNGISYMVNYAGTTGDYRLHINSTTLDFSHVGSADNAFHMHTLRCDGTTLTIFIDAVSVTTLDVSSILITDTGLDFGFGILNSNGTYTSLIDLTVTYDELYIWDAAISDSSITSLLTHYYSKGDDLYTKLLLHYNTSVVTDSSQYSNVLDTDGTVLNTANVELGAGSRNANNSSLRFFNSSVWNSITGDFTFETFFKSTSATATQIFINTGSGTTGWRFYFQGGRLVFDSYTSSTGVVEIYTTLTTIVLNTTRFNHLSVGRKGSTWYFTVDFVVYAATLNWGSATATLASTTFLTTCSAGANNYYDETRLTIDYCRYVASVPPQDYEFISNIAGFTHNLTLSSILDMSHACSIPTIFNLTLSSSFEMAGSSGPAYTGFWNHVVGMVQKLGLQLNRTLSSIVEFTQTLTQLQAFKSNIKIISTLTGFSGRALISTVQFGQSLLANYVLNKTLNSSVKITQYIFSTCSTCSNTPYRGYITLFYPYVTPTTTLDLRNPTFGDTDEVTLNIINKKLISGQSTIFRPSERPMFEKLIYEFDTITNKQDFIDFVEETFGEEIGMIDMQNNTWKGCITDSTINVENYDKLNDAFGFTFEGDKQ